MIVAALALAVQTARRAARNRDSGLEFSARGAVIGTIAMLSAYVFISGQYEKQLWLLLGVSAALGQAASRREPVAPALLEAHGGSQPRNA
jgi:hypothetical protein